MGNEKLTDPTSDTWAAAEGTMALAVGSQLDLAQAKNKVTYKRKGFEAKSIMGGGDSCDIAQAAATGEATISSNLEASGELSAGAQGNGMAESSLESLYGTLLAALCICPKKIEFEVRSDFGGFLRQEYAAARLSLIRDDLETRLQKVQEDIQSGKLDQSADILKARLLEELDAWRKESFPKRLGECE
jgi:hypothetical protein